MLASVALLMGTSVPVYAAGSDESATQLEEVVVTAQRREERLSAVPISITAFKAADLERMQIHDIRDLSNNAPSVTFTSSNWSSNDLILAIRGVAPGSTTPNVDPAVGIYVDGLYFARSQGSNFALTDLSSAEVLRGPQGTLFGRNTIGGALNITTNQPTNNLEGSVKIDYGNYGLFATTAVLNTPIIDDKLAARFVFAHSNHDGYGSATNLGQPLSDQNDNYFRGSLKGKLTDAVTVNLSADYYTGKEHSPLWTVNYLDPVLASAATKAAVSPYFSGQQTRNIPVDFDPMRSSVIQDLTGTITADLGRATLKSITAYRKINFNGAADSDGTPNPLMHYDFKLWGSQFTQEVQLAGKAVDDKLTWLTGVYYFNEDMANNIGIPSSAINLYLAPKNVSESVFAQATYEFLPKVRLTAGARYVHDERDISYSATAGATCFLVLSGLNQVPGGCGYTPRGIAFNYVPWTIGLDYQPNSDSLIYAKISKGFRSGGFQQAGSNAIASYYTPFGPENVLSDEVGTKLSLLNRRLFIDAAAYQTKYNAIQQNALAPGAAIPYFLILNAGKAEINGGEVSATALIEKLRLKAAVGIIDPKFTSGPFYGSPVPTIAKTSWMLGADYPIQLSSGRLNLHADYDHKSRVYFLNTLNPATGLSYSAAQIASFTQEGYGLLNAEISYTLKSDLKLAIWGKNLTDKYYAGRANVTYTSGYNTILVGAPRTFGVSLTYNFGS